MSELKHLEAKIRQLEYVLGTVINWNAREYGVHGCKQLMDMLNDDPEDQEAAWNRRHKES